MTGQFFLVFQAQFNDTLALVLGDVIALIFLLVFRKRDFYFAKRSETGRAKNSCLPTQGDSQDVADTVTRNQTEVVGAVQAI